MIPTCCQCGREKYDMPHVCDRCIRDLERCEEEAREARIAARYILFGYQPSKSAAEHNTFRERWPWLYEGRNQES